MKMVIRDLSLDLVAVLVRGDGDAQGLEDLGRLVEETSCVIMALVDGLFWNSKDKISFRDFIVGLYRGNERVIELIQLKKRKTLDLIRAALDQGAHGVIIGDDLAHDRGPFVSPDDIRRWIIPGHQEIVDTVRGRHGKAFLHSCGNLTRILDMILSAGFDGLHGLALSAENDPVKIKEICRGKMALMGVFEVGRMKPQEIRKLKQELLPCLKTGGGYIIGSSEGLFLNVPLDALYALYE
jgi:uroporphyrinogen decarboxylase